MRIIFLVLIILITALIVTACANPQNQQQPPMRNNVKINNIEIQKEIIHPTPIPQTMIYKNNFNKIQTYGINKTRIKTIISGMNPEYFNDLNLLEVIYSNSQATKSNINGMYYSDNKQITLWVYDESDNYIRYLILHELKHHYCLTKERDDFDRCLKLNNQMWDYCYHNEGCFLNTPIDKEYGIIK